MSGGTARSTLTKPFYLVGMLLMLTPMFNLIMAWPFRVGATDWRFQQFNTLVSGLAPAVLGLAIMLCVARALDQRRMQIGLGFLALVCAAAVLGLFANYALDVLELRALIAPAERGSLFRVALKGALQSLTCVTVLAVVGYTATRSAWRSPAAASRRAEPLLVGRSGSQAADRVHNVSNELPAAHSG